MQGQDHRHRRQCPKAGAHRIVQSDTLRIRNLYREGARPQFHFAAIIGWTNDPNGLLYYAGLWHLFFQPTPYGPNPFKMHWGHAVSRDLVHWTQWPTAIHPRGRGAWSGSGVVDVNNTSGFQTGKEKPIVVAWTSLGRGECIAYSNDGGRTFTEYEGNPVLEHNGRDPKIIYHAPTEKWVMVVFDIRDKVGGLAFHTSDDLKTWIYQSQLPGYHECPELFALPVDGDASKRRWVVYGANAAYVIGSFDGRTFTPDHEGKHTLHHGAYYASQTFSNVPNGRRVQVGSARIGTSGQPFNQMMSFPAELTLRTTPNGIRMFAEPVKELATLYRKSDKFKPMTLQPANPWTYQGDKDGFQVIELEFVGADKTSLSMALPGYIVRWNPSRRGGTIVKGLTPVDGRVRLQILLDCTSVEICRNRGQAMLTAKRGGAPLDGTIRISGNAEITELTVHAVNSIWPDTTKVVVSP